MWCDVPLFLPENDSQLRLVLAYSHRNPLLLGELVRQAQMLGPFGLDTRHLAQLLYEYRISMVMKKMVGKDVSDAKMQQLVDSTLISDALGGVASSNPDPNYRSGTLIDMSVVTRSMEHRELTARDVTGEDTHSRTALHHAAARWDWSLTQRLLEAGAKVDAKCDKSNFGRTPLHECLDGRAAALRQRRPYLAFINADRWSQQRTVAVLLEHKASTLVTDTHRNSALSIALTRAPCEVLEALLRATDSSSGLALEKQMKTYAKLPEQPAFETPENKVLKLVALASWMSTAAASEAGPCATGTIPTRAPRRRRGASVRDGRESAHNSSAA
jgi:hypothetical protein